MKIRILTDTSAEFLQEELERLAVDLIELPVTMDGEEISWQDSEGFWQKLIAGKLARTSQPSPEVIRQKFVEAKEAGDTLVCIFISSKMSGTYERAVAVKEEVGYDNIFVIDSLNASVAQKVLVETACKMRDEGKSAQEIVAKIEELKRRVKLFACLDTLKYLARGGRISKTSAAIGTIIHLKPLITFVDGSVVTFARAFGITQGAQKLFEKMSAVARDPEYDYLPIYTYDSRNTANFVARAKEKGFEIDEAKLTPVGSTVGSHIGPAALGIVYVAKE